MRNVLYNYSSVQINMPDNLSNDIINWGRKNITDNEIFLKKNDNMFGREDEPHITILYGIHECYPNKIKSIVCDMPVINLKLGKVDIFCRHSKFDVVVIKVISDDLNLLNDKLKKNIIYTNQYSKYDPHLTISYVKKGKGWKHNYLNKWENKKFTFDHVIFSSKKGFKKKVNIGNI